MRELACPVPTSALPSLPMDRASYDYSAQAAVAASDEVCIVLAIRLRQRTAVNMHLEVCGKDVFSFVG